MFGISTRLGGVSREPLGMNLSFSVGDDPADVRANRLKFFDMLNIREDRIAFQRQTHSDHVKTVTAPGVYDDCDALVTSGRDVFLAVSVADCVPIFLFDPETTTVAAVHSGWRGSKSQILRTAVATMIDQFGALSEHIIGYIGPSAGVCCYEVGDEVASQFEDKFIARTEGRKPRLDLKRFNRSLLVES